MLSTLSFQLCPSGDLRIRLFPCWNSRFPYILLPDAATQEEPGIMEDVPNMRLIRKRLWSFVYSLRVSLILYSVLARTSAVTVFPKLFFTSFAVVHAPSSAVRYSNLIFLGDSPHPNETPAIFSILIGFAVKSISITTGAEAGTSR